MEESESKILEIDIFKDFKQFVYDHILSSSLK